MDFVKWYNETHDDDWDENYTDSRWAHIATIEYEEFCKRNDIEPIWNG